MSRRASNPRASVLRRFAVGRFLILSVMLGFGPVTPAAAQVAEVAARSATAAGVESVTTIGFTVSDLRRSVEFYSDVLSFDLVSEVEVAGTEWEHLVGLFGARARVARLRLGEETIELTQYLTPAGRPIPADSRSNDRWFQHIAIVVSDMDRAYERLLTQGVMPVSTEPQRLPDWNPAAGGIEAFYFRDPDGHTLEIIHFPPGKGDPRWQRTTALFLGIDHTAIVVNDTEASLAFYRDGLDMRVAGRSLNYGSEQEYLNAVFGARLRITSLRAAAGPGIELLEYVTPSDGRPMPPDELASDLMHWETTLTTDDADAAAELLASAGLRFISSPLLVPTLSSDFSRGFLVRDPDGHVMRIVEP